MTDFCHITPTKYLDLFAAGRTHHLVLAHLIEEDEEYANWYANMPRDPDTIVIMDNSAFEMYKQGKPMYPSAKLIEMGKKVMLFLGIFFIIAWALNREYWKDVH